MKRQFFYIFCQENEIQFKLIKAYMNWFCVNEDDQSEIIEIHHWEELIRKLSISLSLKKETSFLQRMIQQRKKTAAIYTVIEKALKNKIPQTEFLEYQKPGSTKELFGLFRSI